jgi:hypothetical protein
MKDLEKLQMNKCLHSYISNNLYNLETNYNNKMKTYYRKGSPNLAARDKYKTQI